MTNPLACQQCSYERKPSDGGPLTQCPNCGIIFAKYRRQSVSSSPTLPPSIESRVSPLDQPPVSALPPKSADEKYCFECGVAIRQKAEICPKCGVRQLPAPSPSPIGKTTSSGRNKLVAALIAIFLGGLGMHKFYLGQTGAGIVYLIFCWTFIPALIGLVEGILFLLMSEEAFAQKYGGT